MCVFFVSSLLYINNVVSKTNTHNYTERLEIECTPQSCTVLDIQLYMDPQYVLQLSTETE